MTAGIEVINNSGTTLINDRDPVLVLREKRTVSGAPGASYVSGTATFSNTRFPVFAVKTPNWGFIHSVTKSGTDTIVKYGSYTEPGGSAITVELFYFDVPTRSIGQSGAGLAIFNSSGLCMFDSNEKNAIVTSVNPPNGTWTGSPGRTYVMAFYSAWRRRIIRQTDLDYYSDRTYANAAKSINNTVVVNSELMYAGGDNIPGNVSDSDTETGAKGGVILDVTGY